LLKLGEKKGVAAAQKGEKGEKEGVRWVMGEG